MKKTALKLNIFLTSMFLPIIAFAQTSSSNSLCGSIKYTKSIQWYLCEFYQIIGKYIIPLLMLLATMFFMWNIVQYIRYADSEESRRKYKAAMIWGLVALFVLVSVWGIIAIFGGIVGVNTYIIPQINYK